MARSRREAPRDALVACPQSLRLSPDQRGNLQMAGYSSGRLLELETRFLVQYGMDGSRRTPERWSERLYRFALAAGSKDKWRSEAPRTPTVSEPVACPAGLRLTDQQREAFMEKAGYTFDRLVHLEQSFVVRYGLADGALDSPEGWLRRLAGYVTACGKAQSVMTTHGPKPCGPTIFPVTEPRPIAKAPPAPPPLQISAEERAALQAEYEERMRVAAAAKAPRAPITTTPEDLKRRLADQLARLKTG